MPSAISELVRWAVSIIGPAAGDPRTAASVRTPLGQLADRSKWLKMLSDRIWGAELQIIGRSGNVLEITAHGLASNTAVRVFATSGGTIPAPLVADTVYYVRVVDANHIELSATSGPGAAITLTADGSGDQWVSTVPAWITSTLVSDATFGTGTFRDLVVWKAGTQTITGGKTFGGTVTVSGTNRVTLAARARTRILGGKLHVDDEPAPVLPMQLVTDAYASFDLDLPHESTVNAIRIRVSPAAHAVLPGTMPSWELIAYDATGTATPLDNMTDNSVDAAAYSLPHYIEKSGMLINVDRDAYRYRLNFVQESGSNSAPGDLNGGSVDMTVRIYDDAAV